MVTVRKSADRGHAEHGWLDSFHSFSFADYHDPRHMGFRTLRVINEDRVQPARGFATHSHRNMEIVTYVVDGALEHKDSMGNGSVIRPGDVQRMSAGTGVTHSEYNHSDSEPVHLLQIWILPERNELPPSYQEKHFGQAERSGVLRLVASGDGRDGSVTMNQDADLYASILRPSESAQLELRDGRGAWVQVIRGEVAVNGVALRDGDGGAVEEERIVALKAAQDTEVLLFDLT